MTKYVEVATSLPIDRTFQYKVTGKEKYPPEIGKRVYIPFRSAKRVGYIVRIEDKALVENPRELIDIIDETPIFTDDMIKLAEWIKTNYFCSWGEALEAMLPGVLKQGKLSMVSRVKEAQKVYAPTEPHIPNKEQKKVLEIIKECLERSVHEVFLLHGITGSGKTEIYMQAVQEVLSRNKTAIILVPEISLTPQTVERFSSRFGQDVAVFHSKMLQSVKFQEWMRIKKGEAKLVIGPRSAVFSPFNNLGIVIVDEEHEPSYKQEDVPRYHARDVAIERARLNGASVILGSATPSLESYYRAMKGEYRLVELTQRIREKELPRVKLVDMRMEFDTRVGNKIISRVMEEALKKDISQKKQALIFLNRRGFSTFIICRKCGSILKCPRCDSPFILHKKEEELICHYCAGTIAPPKICPTCNEDYLMYKGTGTEKVEEEIKKILPAASIARMDSDSMQKRGSHDKLLGAFKDHKIDIIVGTQMIAKGLDFPKVTLVGVVSADSNLNLPDFRSGERTFNLITQVAGRAGRGDLGGEVIVQTFMPEYYAIRMASKHDYNGFYSEEIKTREELSFPPFTSMVKITLRGRKEDKVINDIKCLAELFRKKTPDLDILGPVPATMAKLRGYYRWNILVKAPNRPAAVDKIRSVMSDFRKTAGVFLAVDVDPMTG